MKEFRSGCPIASTLDMVGDKWTLVIVRDLINGKSRYNELLDGPEGIPTNILANRLKMMEAQGLLRREPYQDKPRRHAYHLTDRGRGLLPVLQAIARWGNGHIPDTWEPPAAFLRARP